MTAKQILTHLMLTYYAENYPFFLLSQKRNQKCHQKITYFLHEINIGLQNQIVRLTCALII